MDLDLDGLAKLVGVAAAAVASVVAAWRTSGRGTVGAGTRRIEDSLAEISARTERTDAKVGAILAWQGRHELEHRARS